MKNNVLQKLFFMLVISIFMSNTADARLCYAPFASYCDSKPSYINLAAAVQTPDPMCVGYNLDAPLGDGYECSECTDSVGTHYKCHLLPQEPEPELEPDPMCVGYDLDAPLGTDYACTECTDSAGTHYKCELVCRADKCAEDEIYNEETCMCDPISDACKKFLHKYKSVAYTPLSSSECGDVKDDLGLQRCVSDGSDYYAGAVMACGGAENLLTAAEAEELAYCMYNPTERYASMYGDRYDGFLRSYNADTRDHVFVWVNWEGFDADNKGAMVRMYDVYGSIPYFAERDGSSYYFDEMVENNWENNSVLSQTLCRL